MRLHRVFLLIASIIVLAGCSSNIPTAEKPDATEREIRNEEDSRIQVAAGAVQATGELLNQNPPAVDAAKKTNNAAAQALPKPSSDTTAQWKNITLSLLNNDDGPLNVALDQLAKSERRQRELEAKLETQRIELNQALEKQAQSDRDRAAAAESRKDIVAKQTYVLTGVGVLMIIGGAFALYRTHVTLAAILGGLGAAFIVLGRVVATLPDWVWSVLFGATAIGIPAALWFGYRRGLFQKPPTKIGEYAVTPEQQQ